MAQYTRAIWSLSALILASACGDGAGAADSGDGGAGLAAGESTGDSSGSGGGGTSGATGDSDSCDPPVGAEIVMGRTKFADATDGPSHGLASDGSVLFAAFWDRVVRITLPSGQPTEVYRWKQPSGPGLRSFEDDTGMIVQDGDTWLRLPYAGGSAENLTVSLPIGADVFDFDTATDTFLATTKDLGDDTVDVVRAAIGDSAPEVLIKDATVGDFRVWLERDGTLFTQGSRPLEGTADDTIYAFAPGMTTPTTVSVTPPANKLIGATSTSLYYVHSEDLEQWGVYRVPHAGGAGTKLREGFFLGAYDYSPELDTFYIGEATQIWRFTEGELPKKVTSIPIGTECMSAQVLARDGYIYSVTWRSEAREHQIWRIAE